jgi:ribosome maturation factor RimP
MGGYLDRGDCTLSRGVVATVASVWYQSSWYLENRDERPMNAREQGAPYNGELEVVLERVLSELGLELIRYNVAGPSRQPKLTVYVDRMGGVTVGECVEATRRLRRSLAEQFGDSRRFSVGVSSPGTDRPLKTERDFRFVQGKRLLVRYQAKDDREAELRMEGVLTEVSEEGVMMRQADSDEPLLIAYDRILDARIKLPY